MSCFQSAEGKVAGNVQMSPGPVGEIVVSRLPGQMSEKKDQSFELNFTFSLSSPDWTFMVVFLDLGDITPARSPPAGATSWTAARPQRWY